MNHVVNSVIRICGIMFIVLGLAMVLTFLVSWISGQWREGLCFLCLGFALVLIGYISRKVWKHRADKLHLGDGFLMVAILWVVMSIAGAAPYVVTGIIPDISSALFESASGFTTTGATVLEDIPHLPYCILFWRCMTCWLGGIGILLLAITLMPALGLNGQRLNTPDNYGPVIEKISPRMIDSIRTIILIYTGLTLLETALLRFSGMTLFNALIHSMSTISTGGFSRYDFGISHFDGVAIPLIMSGFMIASGVNYHLLLHRPRNGFLNFLTHSEIRLYGVLLAGSFVVVSAALLVQDNGMSAGVCLVQAAFQTTSFLSTTGFYSSDYILWPQIAQMILLLLMLCGPCTASCGGGIKVARLSILLKLVRHGISTRLHANFFETVKMNGKGIGTDNVSGTATMPFLYVTALFAGTLFLSLADVPLARAFNASIACLFNTGHAFGTLGPGSTFASFGAFSKLLLSLMMIGGRLELYAIVILMTPRYWKQGH